MLASLRTAIARVRAALTGRARDLELVEEIQAHLELLEQDHVRRGATAASARAAARRDFGGVDQIKEAYRDQRSFALLDDLARDVRYAVRAVRTAPGFTLVSTCVLALGIGANSAMFSLVDAAFVRPLRFPAADELMMLSDVGPSLETNRVSPFTFMEWRRQNRTFTAMAAIAAGERTLTGPQGGAERLPSQSVTVEFFDLLRVKPVAGRGFASGDDAVSPSVVVISERLWKGRFGGDANTVGRSITLDGQSLSVIGIVPQGVQLLSPADVWTPYVPPQTLPVRNVRFLQVIGRLHPRTTVDDARADMNAVAQNLAVAAAPASNKGRGVAVEPLGRALVGRELRMTSLVLAGVVGLILLMACANIASLLLARGLARGREIAIRTALGCSRARIVRQLVTESLVLATMGGAAGLATSWFIVRAAPSMIPPGVLPQGIVVTFDARVVLFATALTVLTGVAFGLVPAWQVARRPLTQPAGGSSRGCIGGTGTLKNMLAVAQVALAVVLLSAAGLLIRTLLALDGVTAGYRADHILTMRVGLPFNRYTQERALGFYRDIEREIGALPGVRTAAIGGDLPLDGAVLGMTFEIVGQPPVDSSNLPVANYQMVSPRYFQALGIPVLRGRGFTDGDTNDAAPVCIINEEFARRYFRDEEPVGARVSIGAMSLREGKPVVRQIVGVIRQVKARPDERENSVEAYVPIAQNPWYSASIVVHAAGDAKTLVARVRAAIARVDNDQPVTRVRTLEEVASESTSRPRFRAQLVGAFAGVALMLASVGVFGVLAVAVRQRRREFGLRMALGARAVDVLRLVVAGGIRIAAAGLALGLAGAAASTRVLASLLFGVQPLDPATFLIVSAVIGGVTLLACAAPALRAVRVDPAIVLKQES